MANTVPSIEVIAQQALDCLQTQAPLADIFSTSFSADIMAAGASVNVPLVTEPTIGSLATGYVGNVQDVTASTSKVTLSAEFGAVMGFTPAELQSAGYDLSGLFVTPAITALTSKIAGDAFALVTGANYGNTEGSTKLTVAVADFDADDVVDVGTYLTTMKAPQAGRSLILSPSYHAALSKDDSVKAAFAYGSNSVVANGVIPSLHGFTPVVEWAALPTGANLKGVAMHKSSIALATRIPAMDGWTGEQMVVTDPATKLSVLLRKWHSNDQGNKLFLSVSVHYGVAKGNAALCRIVSA